MQMGTLSGKLKTYNTEKVTSLKGSNNRSIWLVKQKRTK